MLGDPWYNCAFNTSFFKSNFALENNDKEIPYPFHLALPSGDLLLDLLSLSKYMYISLNVI